MGHTKKAWRDRWGTARVDGLGLELGRPVRFDRSVLLSGRVSRTHDGRLTGRRRLLRGNQQLIRIRRDFDRLHIGARWWERRGGSRASDRLGSNCHLLVFFENEARLIAARRGGGEDRTDYRVDRFPGIEGPRRQSLEIAAHDCTIS